MSRIALYKNNDKLDEKVTIRKNQFLLQRGKKKSELLDRFRCLQNISGINDNSLAATPAVPATIVPPPKPSTPMETRLKRWREAKNRHKPEPPRNQGRIAPKDLLHRPASSLPTVPVRKNPYAYVQAKVNTGLRKIPTPTLKLPERTTFIVPSNVQKLQKKLPAFGSTTSRTTTTRAQAKAKKGADAYRKYVFDNVFPTVDLNSTFILNEKSRRKVDGVVQNDGSHSKSNSGGAEDAGIDPEKVDDKIQKKVHFKANVKIVIPDLTNELNDTVFPNEDSNDVVKKIEKQANKVNEAKNKKDGEITSPDVAPIAQRLRQRESHQSLNINKLIEEQTKKLNAPPTPYSQKKRQKSRSTKKKLPSQVSDQLGEIGDSIKNLSIDDGKVKVAKQFYGELKEQTSKLLKKSTKLQTIILENDVQSIQDECKVVIGQIGLLITKKFNQFTRLVESYETGNKNEEERHTKQEDLDGFWQVVMMQVDDLNARFDKVLKMLNNYQNNCEEQTEHQDKVLDKKPLKKLRPQKSDVKSSGIRDMIKKAREMRQNANKEVSVTIVLDKEPKETETILLPDVEPNPQTPKKADVNGNVEKTPARTPFANKNLLNAQSSTKRMRIAEIMLSASKSVKRDSLIPEGDLENCVDLTTMSCDLRRSNRISMKSSTKKTLNFLELINKK